jgi:hypothetical protein
MTINYDGILINASYSNFQLLNDVADKLSTIPYPQIPKYFSKKRNDWFDYPDDPSYYEAIKLYNLKKNLLVYDVFLNNAITLTKTIDINVVRRLRRFIITKDSDKLLYIKYYLLTEENLNDILYENLLFESHVDIYINFFSIKRNNQNILSYPLRNNVDVNIEYEQIYIGENVLVHPLHEYNACISSGMNWINWTKNEYDKSSKAYTIALYRLNKLTEIHSNDEVQSKSSKK